MSNELRVLLEGRPAGTLDRLSNGRLHFEYDPAYQVLPNPTPLSISMPVQERAHGHARLEPWLAGLLPDDTAVQRRWARAFGLSTIAPFALLSTPIGEDCAGAVQFVRPVRVDALLADAGSVQWLAPDDLEGRLQRLRTEGTAWLGEGDPRPGFVGRFSLAGRQRKTALLFDGERWGVPAGRIPTTHILKPAIAEYVDQQINEHLCLTAARHAGLIAAKTEVVEFGAESVVVVTRYDRNKKDDQLVRVHQEDLCQALGVHPDRKYQADGGPGPRQIANLLRAAMSVEVAEQSVARFADALIWNWIVGGTDAHAKNYSLLLSGSAVRLAPLYDITSALPYGNPHDLRLAMKLDDGYRLLHHRNPWLEAAGVLGMDPDLLTSRAVSLCELAPAAFSQAASGADQVAIARSSTDRLIDLVSQSATRCLRILR